MWFKMVHIWAKSPEGREKNGWSLNFSHFLKSNQKHWLRRSRTRSGTCTGWSLGYILIWRGRIGGRLFLMVHFALELETVSLCAPKGMNSLSGVARVFKKRVSFDTINEQSVRDAPWSRIRDILKDGQHIWTSWHIQGTWGQSHVPSIRGLAQESQSPIIFQMGGFQFIFYVIYHHFQSFRTFLMYNICRRPIYIKGSIFIDDPVIWFRFFKACHRFRFLLLLEYNTYVEWRWLWGDSSGLRAISSGLGGLWGTLADFEGTLADFEGTLADFGGTLADFGGL